MLSISIILKLLSLKFKSRYWKVKSYQNSDIATHLKAFVYAFSWQYLRMILFYFKAILVFVDNI